MEAHEIAEQIHEQAEEHPEEHDWFRRIAAIYVGVAAMLLAIAALGGSDATKEMLNANIHASDTYAFYQSKYIRQVSTKLLPSSWNCWPPVLPACRPITSPRSRRW